LCRGTKKTAGKGVTKSLRRKAGSEEDKKGGEQTVTEPSKSWGRAHQGKQKKGSSKKKKGTQFQPECSGFKKSRKGKKWPKRGKRTGVEDDF